MQDPGEELGAIALTWPTRDGDVLVDVTIAEVAGRPECVRLDIRATPGTLPTLSAVRLRALPIGQLRAAAIRELVDRLRLERGVEATIARMLGLEAYPPAPADTEEGLRRRATDAASPHRGGRPPKYGPEHFRRVADGYLSALADGSPRPTSDVARSFGVKRTTAAKWVSKARALGLLGPAAARRPAQSRRRRSR